MIAQALSVAGTAQKVMTLKLKEWIYFRNLGPGNVRWGTSKEPLEQGPAPGLNQGLPQSIADGEKNREWIGDLWVITDTPGTQIIVVCPAKDHSLQTGFLR